MNTSSEFDGSDSGARPDEAISWGKIRQVVVVCVVSGADLMGKMVIFKLRGVFFPLNL